MAAITSAAIGVGVNAWNVASNMKQKKQAQRELNDYERQSLDNAYKNIQISTTGTDIMRDENNRTTASLLDSVQNMGSRGVFGALPKIQMQNNIANQEIRANLDNQILKRDYAIADDETRLRDIKENRDNQNISALSSQINSANQGIQDGIYGVASGISSITGSIGSSTTSSSSNNSEVELGGDLKSAGLAPLPKAKITSDINLDEINKRNFKY